MHLLQLKLWNYVLTQDEEQNFPEQTINSVKNGFYVDDLVTDCQIREEAFFIKEQLCSLLSKGGFLLHTSTVVPPVF